MLDRNAIAQAIEDLAVNLVIELGYDSIYAPAADSDCPSDEDIAHALREPVSMGAVLLDLCRLLGINPPPVVTLAMNEAGVLA